VFLGDEFGWAFKTEAMRILICHERFLFRFGADRVLILLGKGLAERGYTVSIMANRYDRPILEQFAARIVDVPEPPGRYFYLNEDTVDWLRTAWESLFDDRTRPDVILVGGWPFYAAIPFFRSVCPEVIYVDCGAVPLEGYEGGALRTQQKLRQLRAEFLPQVSRIVVNSDFTRKTQSVVDSGGAVPAQTILLGADHVENSLWASAHVRGAEPSGQALAVVDGLKAAGRKVILSLGRWETGCYKNSEEALALLRAVREQIPYAVLAILAPADVEIPSDLREAVHLLGFPDDTELAEIMRKSDLGVSLSRWEGFNLPLAEMQWLNRPALAYDLAAHPEVILHPRFLCSDFGDMVGKSVAILSGRGLSGEIHAEALLRFRHRFRWSRMIEEFQQLLTGRSDSRIHLVIDVSNSTKDPANSGVIRVTRRFGRALQRCEDPLFVVWQAGANRYVLPTREEFAQLGQFNGPLLSSQKRLSPSASERVDLEQAFDRFGRRDPWLISTETMTELRFQQIRHYVRRLDLRAAAIFHDAIPVLRPDLCNEEMRANHLGYMTGLAECDVVVPISRYSAQCLRDSWNAQGITGCMIRADVLPGEFGGSIRTTSPSPDTNVVQILCVSTLEPRKNHRRLVEACLSVDESHPNLRWKLTLVGNKYQGAFEIADWIQEVSRHHPEVQWFGIVDDDTLRRLYQEAAFTVYPSVIEGFGMPILESIWFGRPCICSHDGVMGELAREGGCLTADVEDVRALAEAIATLAEDRQLRHRLSGEAAARKLKTWDDYGEEFMGILSATPPPVHPTVSAAPLPSGGGPAPHRPVPWTDILYSSCILQNWQMHDGERLALLGLLARHKPHCSIEVGTFLGGSLSLIAQFSDLVFSIDSDPAVVRRVPPIPNVTFLTGDSADVLPALFRELTAAHIAVDFILLDGDNSQAATKRDIGLVLQYVPLKPLFVVMHDSFNPECRQAILDSAWADSPYCHWVELDLVPGRAADYDGPIKGELWGGLAAAYFQPTPRDGPLSFNRTADSTFRTMAENFQAKKSRTV